MPTKRYGVLIVEVDGTELEFQEELALDSDNVFFTAAGYTSDNAQDAIIETITKSGAARTPYGFYYDANANTGRWLEVNKGVSSQTSPHVMPEVGILKAVTLSVKNNATCTIEIYKNGVSLQAITLTAEQTKVISGLSISLLASDELSAQVTSGSCTEPNIQVQVQVSA